MSTGWKIFKVANIVEVIIISALIATGMYLNPLPLNNPDDYFIFAFICSVPVITAINCIGNIFMVNQSKGKKLSLGRRISFWIFFTLFTGIMILISYGLLDIFSRYISRSLNPRLLMRQMILFCTMLVFLFNGLYILVMQVKLYIQVRKKYIQADLLMIEELGKEQNG